MVMPAYRLVTHNMLSLYSALPYANSVNNPVKLTGVLPLNLFNNSDLNGVKKNQNTVISQYSRQTTACPKQQCLLSLRIYISSTNMMLHTRRNTYTHIHMLWLMLCIFIMLFRTLIQHQVKQNESGMV